jgi:hypothetical protein
MAGGQRAVCLARGGCFLRRVGVGDEMMVHRPFMWAGLVRVGGHGVVELLEEGGVLFRAV